MDNNADEIIFEIVHKSDGRSSNKVSKVFIETSVKGLIYRTNVYLDSFLVDAKEINCIDIATLDNGPSVFRERYLATHKAFEKQYFMEKVFSNVLSNKGDYIHADGICEVNTYLFENIIKTEVLVDGNEMEVEEFEVSEELLNDKKGFKLKYTKAHADFMKHNIIIPKFPVNTFLNKTLKKYPLYDSNPMHSFYLFLVSLVLVLWILSQIICGKALPKIVKKVAGKDAGLVMRDMQKSMCIRSKSKNPEDKKAVKDLLHDKVYRDGYLIIPEKTEFKNNSEIKTVYVKNSMDGDLILTLNNKVIEKFDNAIITPEMIINVITPKTLIIKPSEIGVIEFKIEDSFIKNSNIKEGTYIGKLIFEVIKVRYNTKSIKSVTFTFKVEKDIKVKKDAK